MNLNVLHGIDNFDEGQEKTVVTIGTFDGLHLGHQAILTRLMEVAGKRGWPALAITFEPHPRVLVTPDSPPPLLTCLNEKIRLFSDYLDGMLLILKFDRELMNLTAEQFTKNYLVDRINVGKLIVGYDHAFGKDRSGTVNDLIELSRKYSFELEIVNPVIVENKPISSSRIRRLMADNHYAEALKLFGHPYPLSGTVTKGIGLGKELGYPTANIRINPRKLLPADGVYSCSVELDHRKLDGMMFIGRNHFNPEAVKSIEINIFDFDEEIYDRELYCFPEVFIRESRKYNETSQLAEQLKIDKENVMRIKK